MTTRPWCVCCAAPAAPSSRRQQGRRRAHRGRCHGLRGTSASTRPHAVSALQRPRRRRPSRRDLAVLPEISAVAGGVCRGRPRHVALIGRPNVGKSSLLNKLAGADRVVVDDVAGTTRDPVDEVVEIGGRVWRFVDTAGIRRRVHQTRGADFCLLRTQTALEKAEVAVVPIDASEQISEQDVRVIQQVVDAGRALVLAINKWDTR